MSASFKLAPEQVAVLVKVTPRREPTPSIYLEDVKTAAKEPDVGFGIAVTKNAGTGEVDPKSVRKIISELQKAAKQIGVKVRVFDRTKPDARIPEPFVGFKVVVQDEPEVAETVAI